MSIKSVVSVSVAVSLQIVAFCAVALAQSGSGKPVAAVYINDVKGKKEERDALRDAVYNVLVKSKRYRMVAVNAIDNVIEKEHIRQMNSTVDENTIAKLGRKAGAQYVCVISRSELDGSAYLNTSMVNVETGVAEEGQSEMRELEPGAKLLDVVRTQVTEMLQIDW
jgi:hypothetical protein